MFRVQGSVEGFRLKGLCPVRVFNPKGFFIRVSRDFIRAISEVSSRFWGVSVGFGGAGVWES